MKVITRMLSSHMSIYDDSIAVGTNYLARARRFWNTSQTPSFIMDNITDQSINNHHAFLGWNIFDEPDYFKLPACFPDIITYSGHFSRNPQYNNTIPLLNKPDRLSAARIMHKNYHDIVVSNTTYNNYHKPVFGNFTGNTLDFNYNYETYDIASFDVYPFGKDRTYDGLGGCVGISKSLFASAIKNNKQSTMTWLQGVGSELMDANGIPLWGTPNQYAQRFALFSQAIEGIRGFMYFMHPSMLNNDTLNASIFLATSEFNNYIPIFCKENLNYKVSTSFDRINSGDYFDWGMSKFSNDNYINYSYHYDTTANIYYLFVSNDIYFDVKDIKYTVWVDPGTPNDVYLLAPDYFKNGLYDEIYSQKNGNGGYIRFEDNISQRDIKIYTIGGLPPLNHKTIADSIGMKGSLSYSNQRKMIAYPYRQDEVFDYGSTDTVRYHAVYHHLIPNTNRYGIYYRRSNPMVRAYSQDLIDWEPNDYLISSQVFDNTSFCNYPTNCMYPSIVVRYDYTNPIPMLQKPKAYIVYTCKTCDGDVSFDNYVVENIFSANDNVQNVPASVGNVIGKIHGYDMNIFGTPTISAVYNGNIYSWSDEQRGIIAGFKQPHLTNIQNSDTLCLHWNSMNIGGEKVIALHPSVNSYSRIHLGENNCSLVWQEKDSSFNPFLPITYHQIYYTRLTYDTYLGRLIQYLPNTFSDPNWTVPVNANNTIAHLSNTGIFSNINNYIPSVYRGVEDYVQHPRPNDSLTLFQTKYDRVFWEGDYSVGPFFSSSNIYYRALDILDNPNGTPNSWLAFSPFKICPAISNIQL